jgi:hypothetical protein
VRRRVAHALRATFERCSGVRLAFAFLRRLRAPFGRVVRFLQPSEVRLHQFGNRSGDGEQTQLTFGFDRVHKTAWFRLFEHPRKVARFPIVSSGPSFLEQLRILTFSWPQNYRRRLICRDRLLSVLILRLGFLQDRNVGVGVFPECEEVLVSTSCFGCVAL